MPKEKKYPYKVVGSGYLHRPSYTYLEDGNFRRLFKILQEIDDTATDGDDDAVKRSEEDGKCLASTHQN